MIPKHILKQVKLIEIRTRNLVNSVLAGAYTSAFKGRGMEFAEVREYQPGDDVRNIDWNVTAKTGVPHTKKFTEERELTVMLVVDASASGDFGSEKEMKGQIMAMISALLAFSAIKNNDRIGLLIFTSKVEKFVPPQKGKSHVLRVIRELLYFKPEQKGTDLTTALEYLNRILKRRSVVFLLSDFETSGYEKQIKLLRQRHDVVALKVMDHREMEMPNAGFIELEDSETGENWIIDTGSAAFRELFHKEALKNSLQQQQLFRKLNMDYVQIEVKPEFEDTISPLLNFFRRRTQQSARR